MDSIYSTPRDFYDNLKKVKGFSAKRRLIFDFWSFDEYCIDKDKTTGKRTYIFTIFNTFSFRYFSRKV